MDPQNPDAFASRDAIDYWQNVDLYIGGTEHATGHLLYSRFWNKFLKDRGYVPHEEPFKKLINQGMIQGRSNFVYRWQSYQNSANEIILVGRPMFISYDIWNTMVSDPENSGPFLKDILTKQLGEEDWRDWDIVKGIEVSALRVDVNNVENDVLMDIEALRVYHPNLDHVKLICKPDGAFLCGWEVEKMSKSKYNVVNPDDVVERYGADVLRLYEMFLGPLEQAKPWNTNGIDGVYRFIRKFWRLFYKDSADGSSQWIVTEEQPTPAELKILHKTIKKAEDDIDAYSFNTSVSSFMICVNELASLNCHKRAILQDLVLILSPYAPHICEELWAALGNEPGSVSRAAFPTFNPAYLVEDTFEYPVQINGKVRTTISFAIDRAPTDIEREVLADEIVQKWLDGKQPKKVVVVPKRIVNVVI